MNRQVFQQHIVRLAFLWQQDSWAESETIQATKAPFRNYESKLQVRNEKILYWSWQGQDERKINRTKQLIKAVVEKADCRQFFFAKNITNTIAPSKSSRKKIYLSVGHPRITTVERMSPIRSIADGNAARPWWLAKASTGPYGRTKSSSGVDPLVICLYPLYGSCRHWSSGFHHAPRPQFQLVRLAVRADHVCAERIFGVGRFSGGSVGSPPAAQVTQEDHIENCTHQTHGRDAHYNAYPRAERQFFVIYQTKFLKKLKQYDMKIL